MKRTLRWILAGMIILAVMALAIGTAGAETERKLRTKMPAAMKDYQQQLDDMVKEITKHTKYTEEEVKENIKADWIIRADEALEKGIIDGIVEDIDILL